MLKVFLVEDETVIREGIRDKIEWEQYGYRFVGEAADGEIALPLIRKLKPDVLITDIKMPFMDGLSLSRIVHTEFPKMKIIILSGYDDFEYARQAIEVGVEQYLLKPITRLTLKKLLVELREKIEQERERGDYQKLFQSEMHEYEQYSRRRFFERVLGGELSVKGIYEEAAKQGIEIDAPCYNLLLFSLQDKKREYGRQETDRVGELQDEILHYFLRNPHFVVFRSNVESYEVLIKAEKERVQELTENSVEQIRRVCMPAENKIRWYVACGQPVERLSMLAECDQGVNHYYSYRFMLPEVHIFNQESLREYVNVGEDNKIDSVDSRTMDPEIIREFLLRGNSSEIREFVTNYLYCIREALASRMFRNYVILNIRFAIIAYLESLGVTKNEYMDHIRNYGQETSMKAEDVQEYFISMLETALHIREKESDLQSSTILRKAVDYINANYDKDNISLNSVAKEVEVSANYLSAIFSQSMQNTFVEYVTGKRMEKAKKILRGSDKSTSEVASEVGYKDPHYFSFVFKKTQGCSPREYRSGKKV